MNFKNICAIAALIFITSNTSCAAKKKEIFIPGPTQGQIEFWRTYDSDLKNRIKFEAEGEVERTLIELYAKEHPLPTLHPRQKMLADDIRKDCEYINHEIIGTLTAQERVEKLSSKELQDYYEKIKSDPKSYSWASRIFNDGFPSFENTDSFLRQIQSVLSLSWGEEEAAKLEKQPQEILKKHPLYINRVKECKEGRVKDLDSVVFSAFYDLIQKQAQQLVQKMSNGQVKAYYENHPDPFTTQPTFSMDNIATIRRDIPYRMFKDLIQKTLRPIAQKYTFKSDSPEVLAYIEELRSGKDQS